MINCRQATRLASKSMEAQLPLGQRFSLRLHLLFCGFCRRATKHFRYLRSASARFDENFPTTPDSGPDCLTSQARQRIYQALEKADS